MIAQFTSPTTGSLLVEDGPVLRDSDGRRWPVVDGIAYLRVGRDDLAAHAVERLTADDREGALVALLADQDDWWTGAKPDGAALCRLVRDQNRLSLREAMACLAFDRVGDYFAHRWSDPTFLAGLALLEAHWQPAATAFELACGIGHYGRELARRGVSFTGGDVVFSKLWLARHWVLPDDARLVCFDAAAPWPVWREHYDLVFCHDAFYFLEPKSLILESLRDLAAPQGRVAISHVHNSGVGNLSSGHAVSADDIARLFPEATVYDDAELTRALVEARAPRAAPLAELAGVEAFSIEDRAVGAAAALVGGLSVPPVEADLRRNPLYVASLEGWTVRYPSPRYEAEYGPRATYPATLPEHAEASLSALWPSAQPAPDRSSAIRKRILVDLPERW